MQNIVNQKFVVTEDTVVLPVSEIPENSAILFSHDKSDFLITLKHSRSTTKVISKDMADLVLMFNSPQTIVAAIRLFSKENKISQNDVLANAGPILLELIERGFLVAEGSERISKKMAACRAGDWINNYRVTKCIVMLTDTEVYQAEAPDGQIAIIKISSGDTGSQKPDTFMNGLFKEARILKHLDGTVTPRLLGTGVFQDKPYNVIEWVDGESPVEYAKSIRSGGAGALSSFNALVGVALSLLDAYLHLHEQGIVHSDVHPGNIMVEKNQAVKLIDFGASFEAGAQSSEPIGGVMQYLAPEVAKANIEKNKYYRPMQAINTQ